MTDACVVLVTVPDEAAAVTLARTLVSERLAACGNIIPGLRSLYRWQGSVHEDAEVLLLLKTMQSKVEQLSARVRELHSYELPEAIALPVAGGLRSYLDWIEESTRTEEEKS